MQSIASNNYMSTRAWMQEAVAGQRLILRGVSALEYLQYFVGYLGENSIDVYSQSRGMYSNINYFVVDDFSSIDFVLINGVMCSTPTQAVNDLLADFSNIDEESLANALSNYYHRNNQTFTGLDIAPGNLPAFNSIRDWAVEYYNDSF